MSIKVRLVAAGVEGGVQLGVGVSECKLLYREWKNNKVLMYGTESYIVLYIVY